MNPRPEQPPLAGEEPAVGRPYEKPEIQRVDLALAETLSQGCKAETDNLCVGPPLTALEGGS
ncbi:MAG: hypothetical protein AB7V22_00250 [Kiritimatiellia bacterium]